MIEIVTEDSQEFLLIGRGYVDICEDICRRTMLD